MRSIQLVPYEEPALDELLALRGMFGQPHCLNVLSSFIELIATVDWWTECLQLLLPCCGPGVFRNLYWHHRGGSDGINNLLVPRSFNCRLMELTSILGFLASRAELQELYAGGYNEPWQKSELYDVSGISGPSVTRQAASSSGLKPRHGEEVICPWLSFFKRCA